MAVSGRWIVAALLTALIVPQWGHSAERLRPAIWAGEFYPKDPGRLRQTLADLKAQADCHTVEQPPPGPLRALILPHAGYAYSGPTAAYADCVLASETIAKVILMGPDHRVGFNNGAISDVDAYQTPLGRVGLHPQAAILRQDAGLFTANAASDNQEHSLEVILPFLQFSLGDFQLLPIVLGPCDYRQVAARLDPLIDAKTLVVVSTDLSHYLPYGLAKARDTATINAIIGGDGQMLSEPNRACGVYAVLVLQQLASSRGWKARLLHYATSGDHGGDRSKVVGYAAIAFYGNGEEKMIQEKSSTLTADQGKALVQLARKTLMERFGLRVSADQQAELTSQIADPALQTVCGTFVTLKIRDQLRGCIGSLEGREPLASGVVTQAVNAAFHDPRFTPLKQDELERVTIEVSVLTKPQPLAYTDAKDLLAKLRPHIDGVTIHQGYAGATFLPQVWEQLPRAEDFLSHLCLKAGLDSQTWRKGKLKVETYQVQYFEEPH
jgi:AmmeMemoRadiSam system protein B/AmmeMemoRadiSam system protein A